jgi:geranylgeranyl pyrophosphate synthase
MDENAYLSMIGSKTGALFSAAGELAILAAGGGDLERAWAAELGEIIGIAFQISDDLLDFDGNTDIMGKPRYMDILSGQYTLPVIHALRGWNRSEVTNIIGDNIASLIDTVRKNGGIDYAYSTVERFLDRARGIVARFENPAGQEQFERFLAGIPGRVR